MRVVGRPEDDIVDARAAMLLIAVVCCCSVCCCVVRAAWLVALDHERAHVTRDERDPFRVRSHGDGDRGMAVSSCVGRARVAETDTESVDVFGIPLCGPHAFDLASRSVKSSCRRGRARRRRRPRSYDVPLVPRWHSLPVPLLGAHAVGNPPGSATGARAGRRAGCGPHCPACTDQAAGGAQQLHHRASGGGASSRVGSSRRDETGVAVSAVRSLTANAHADSRGHPATPPSLLAAGWLPVPPGPDPGEPAVLRGRARRRPPLPAHLGW